MRLVRFWSMVPLQPTSYRPITVHMMVNIKHIISHLISKTVHNMVCVLLKYDCGTMILHTTWKIISYGNDTYSVGQTNMWIFLFGTKYMLIILTADISFINVANFQVFLIKFIINGRSLQQFNSIWPSVPCDGTKPLPEPMLTSYISKVQSHSSMGNFTRDISATSH